MKTLQSHIRSGNTSYRYLQIKNKTVLVRTIFTSKFFLPCPPLITTHFSKHSYRVTAGVPQPSPPPRYFLQPPPAPSRRPPGWGWGPPAHSSTPAHSQTVRMLSKMVMNRQRLSLQTTRTHYSLLLHLLLQKFGHKSGWLLWELEILLKSGVNQFSCHPMSLSEFLDILPLVISPLWRQCGQFKFLHRGALGLPLLLPISHP
jgi:hypothetical protein